MPDTDTDTNGMVVADDERELIEQLRERCSAINRVSLAVWERLSGGVSGGAEVGTGGYYSPATVGRPVAWIETGELVTVRCRSVEGGLLTVEFFPWGEPSDVRARIHWPSDRTREEADIEAVVLCVATSLNVVLRTQHALESAPEPVAVDQAAEVSR